MNRKGTATVIVLVVLILSGAGIFFGYKNFSRPAFQSIAIDNQSENMPESDSEAAVAVEEKSAEEKTNDNPSIEKAQDLSREIENENENDKAGTSNSGLAIKDKLTSWGFAKGSERRVVDTVVIHSSYDAMGKDPYDVSGLIREYKEYGVAPHYLIDRGGNVYRLVRENDIAYHAGESRTPDGRENVNNFSIGIEMMTIKEDKCTAKQYAALNDLLTDLKNKYKIKYVLGHNEIAPGRKDDPWNFDWNKIKKL